MIKTRYVLEKIKEFKGFKNDFQLAVDMGVNLDTLRAWALNDVIRKVLIEYCLKNGMSLDYVFGNTPTCRSDWIINEDIKNNGGN